MKRTDKRIPYDTPRCGCIVLDPADIICDSPNHPGDDLPWYPGEGDDEL